MEFWKQYWTLIRSFKVGIFKAMVWILVAQMVMVAESYMFKMMFDLISLHGGMEIEQSESRILCFVQGLANGSIWITTFVVLLVTPLSGVLTGWIYKRSSLSSTSVGLELQRSLPVRCLRQLLHLSVGYNIRKRTGEKLTRLKNSVAAVDTMTSAIFYHLAPRLLRTPLSFIVICYFDWHVALVLVPVVLFSYFLIRWAVKNTTSARRSRSDWQQKASKLAVQALSNVQTVVLFGQGDKTCDDLGQANSALRDAAWDEKIEYSKVAQVMSFLHMATTSAVVAVCIVDFSAGRISVGTIVLLFFLGNRILADVNMFVEQVAVIGQQKEEVLRLCQLFQERTDVPLVEQPLSVDPLRGALTLEKVGFAYPNRRDTEVLRQIDMVVAPGETLAIVGLSGSGKSTLVRLLMRFFDVDSGRILVDGKDLRKIDLDQYYSQVGVVSQTVELFDDTVAANIAFGKPEATQDEIERAAKMACIHEFIVSQPGGYNTIIGEKGVELSGGQQQRLAIARAIIRDPRILILDEATSHQDMETEGDIKKEIEQVRKDRTLIVIAHRLSTIQKADHIVCLEDGRIIEEGDHERLMQQNGLYSRLQHMRDAGHLSD